MMDRPNTPVPDELYAVRTEIKRLEERENELKVLLIQNPELRTGASYLAEVQTSKRATTDWKELRAAYPRIVDEYTYHLDTTRVMLKGIDQDTGEIVSTRKLQK